MIYQVNYNRGYNTPVCATEYVHADSHDEAWVMGDCKAMYPERVFDVYPIKDAAIGVHWMTPNYHNIIDMCIDEGVKFALNDTEGMPHQLDLIERLAERINTEIWCQLDHYFSFNETP